MLRLLIFGGLLIPHVVARTANRSASFANALLEIREEKEPPTWDELAESGKKYYKAWQDRQGSDDPFPEWVQEKQTRDTLRWNSEPASPFISNSPQSQVQYAEFGLDITPPKAKKGAKSKPGRFACWINVEHGVFIARNIDWGTVKDKDEGETESINDDKYFSQIAWWMWVTAVSKNPDHEQDSQGEDANSGLTTLWAKNVVNKLTRSTMDRATDGKPTGDYSFSPDCNDDAFWPLLATPVVSWMIFLLTERKIALNGKGIQSLTIKKTVSANKYNSYSLWADLDQGPS